MNIKRYIILIIITLLTLFFTKYPNSIKSIYQYITAPTSKYYKVNNPYWYLVSESDHYSIFSKISIYNDIINIMNSIPNTIKEGRVINGIDYILTNRQDSNNKVILEYSVKSKRLLSTNRDSIIYSIIDKKMNSRIEFYTDRSRLKELLSVYYTIERL
jgi:hypothetical protein